MTGLPYDPIDPPLDPPVECGHELMWKLARALWEAHEASADRFCLVGACQSENYLHPCSPAQLAQDGMRAACLPSYAQRAVGE